MTLNDKFRKLCRLCGDLGTINIFGSIGQSLDLSEKINTLLPVNIMLNDHLSTMVCNTCINHVEIISRLVEMGVHTNELMIKLLEKKENTFRERMQKLCRICGNPGFLDIYNQFGAHSVNLADKINSFLSLKVSAKDLLSLKICQNCVVQIENVYPIFEYCNSTINLLPVNSENLNPDIVKIENTLSEITDTFNSNIEITVGEITIEENDNKENEFDFFNIKKEDYENKNIAIIVEETSEKTNQSQCLRCTEVFSNGANLRRHILSTHNLKELDCHHCFRRCAGVAEFENHVKLHFPEKYFPCDLCVFGFDSLSNLIRHIRRHNLPSTREWALSYSLPDNYNFYSCQYCDKNFIFEASKEYHERTHFTCLICEMCGKKLPNKSQLSVHQRQHTGERPYECTNCSSSFKCLSTLRQHEVVHSEKKYCCEVCLRKFSRPEKVRIHMRVHTGEKPYSCLKCNKKYQQKNDLNRHLKNKHKETPTMINLR